MNIDTFEKKILGKKDADKLILWLSRLNNKMKKDFNCSLVIEEYYVDEDSNKAIVEETKLMEQDTTKTEVKTLDDMEDGEFRNFGKVYIKSVNLSGNKTILNCSHSQGDFETSFNKDIKPSNKAYWEILKQNDLPCFESGKSIKLRIRKVVRNGNIYYNAYPLEKKNNTSEEV